MWDEREEEEEEEEEEGRAARLRRQWGRRCGRAGRQARGGERVVLQHVCARYDDLSVSVAAQWVTRQRARAPAGGHLSRAARGGGAGRRDRPDVPNAKKALKGCCGQTSALCEAIGRQHQQQVTGRREWGMNSSSSSSSSNAGRGRGRWDG